MNHRLWGTVHTVLDVTRERQIEKNLHQSESMYGAITDFAGMGIMLFRRDGVLYYNEQLSRFMGNGEKHVTLDDLIEWVDPEDRQELVPQPGEPVRRNSRKGPLGIPCPAERHDTVLSLQCAGDGV